MLPPSGFCVHKQVFSQQQCQEIRQALAADVTDYKIRDVLVKKPAVLNLLRQDKFIDLLSPLAIVRSVFFQKPATANWRVPWHQDVLIQVKSPITDSEFTAWSQKERVWHVQPPLACMQAMLSFRIHLTRCHAQDGALRVLPGSHTDGYRDFAGLGDFAEAGSEIIACDAGDVLVFSPLLVHSSLPVLGDEARAVLHLEATQQQLAHGLQWYSQQVL